MPSDPKEAAQFRMPIMLDNHGTGYLTFVVTDVHRRRAQSNHRQTLERLRERGGLDPGEMLHILQDRQLFPYRPAQLSDLQPYGELS